MELNFIIGDYQKSGTSFLDSLLRQHAEIDMLVRDPSLNFFSSSKTFKKGFEWYKSLFKDLDQKKIIGQTMAGCASNPDAIKRIKKYFPDIKLIFVLRDPIQRTHSHYWHEVKVGREGCSFKKALELEEARIQKSEWNFGTYSYVTRSMYHVHFKNICEEIPKDNILLIKLEDLKSETLKTYNKICHFLEIDVITNLDEINIKSARVNKARVPRNIWVQRMSYYFRFVKLGRLMTFIHNLNLEDREPPFMEKDVEEYLRNKLEKAISFYNSI